MDADLNSKIDEAYTLAESGETDKAVSAYTKIIEDNTGRSRSIDGALYTDLITLFSKSGDTASAKQWYQKMLDSRIPGLELYIKNLNYMGIKY